MNDRSLTAVSVALVLAVLSAHLAEAATNRYVSPSGSEASPYTTWATAAKTIQKAINVCNNGDTVLVTNGTYSIASQVSVTNGITVSSVNGATVTIIDGGGVRRCVYIGASNAVVDGFTIRNGRADGNASPVSYYGGGVLIYTNGSVRNCVITNNISNRGGGGLFLFWGGLVRNSLIAYNRSLDAREFGGGLWSYGGRVESCTITHNQADSGGGIAADSPATVVNSIIYQNTANTNSDVLLGGTFSYCCTPSVIAGAGNITNDPAFVQGFRLASGSPCIDKGTNLAWMTGACDLDGNDRIGGDKVDIGAYEVDWSPIDVLRIVTMGSGTDGSPRLSFTTVAGITNYQVECSSNLVATDWVCLGTPIVAVTGTPELVDYDQGSAMLFYRVKGLPPPDTTPPADIAGFVAIDGDSLVALRWLNPTDPDFSGVRIQRKTGGYPSGIGDGTTIYNGNGTNTTDVGLTNGTACYYKAFSYDFSTNYAGGVTATATPASSDLTPPADIGEFVASGGNGQVVLRWTNPADPDFAGVRIQRKADGYPADTTDGTTIYSGSGTNTTDTGLTNGRIYYYKAFSYDEVPNYAGGATAAAMPRSGSGGMTYAVLYEFTGGTDGRAPYAGLVQGTNGDLYGTTAQGGSGGNGTVFRMSPTGTLTTIHLFSGGDNGGNPQAGLMQGTDGNFYGTTYQGGAAPNRRGTVFRITPDGSHSVLFRFGTGTAGEGSGPLAGLVQGTNGIFYGTTSAGGTNGMGTVFKMTSSGTLTTLHKFDANAGEGKDPRAGLVEGTNGFLYGTTRLGGTLDNGTVFRIRYDGTFTTIHSFAGGSSGDSPLAGLVQGTDSNFYGTTYSASTGFRITPSGSLAVLHSFASSEGTYVQGGLVQAIDGNFYGTASGGGGTGYSGTIFMMTPGGSLTVLHRFNGGNGGGPLAGLVQGTDGSLYGTTSYGGTYNYGVVFRLSFD